jgi:predicted negative regulator of RcsB-dependent stress response
LREAAYATLTDDDRKLAHGLAGRFLEASGHTDSIALARHFAGGAMSERAVYWYRRAAELALEGNDTAAVLERVRLAAAAGADGDELGRLSLLRAEAHKWRGENKEAEEHAADAMQRLRGGSAEWFRAAAEAAAAAGKLRHREPLVAISEALLAADASFELDAARVAWARTATQFCYMGMLDYADRLLARIESVGGAAAAPPQAAGYIYEALAVRGDELARIRFGDRAIAAFEAAGDERNACNLRIAVSFGLNELGAYRRSMPLLRTTLGSAERFGLHNVQATAGIQLGLAMYCTGDLSGAEELLMRALLACRTQGNRLMEGAALSYLATIALARGDVATAERHLHTTIAVAGETWMLRASVDAMLARVRLAQGAPGEALIDARAACAAMAKAGERTTRKGLVRLVLAEALHAAGKLDEAREALREAQGQIRARAAELDETLRGDFLAAQPDHARTLRWAEEWLDATVG